MGDEGGLDQYMTYMKENYTRQYNEIAADHMINPRNCEELTEFSGFGMADYGTDHSIMIWIKSEGDKIEETSFSSDPCPICTATGSAVTELVRNKTLDFAKNLTKDDVIKFLHGMPEEAMKCIEIGIEAIHQAAEDASTFVPFN